MVTVFVFDEPISMRESSGWWGNVYWLGRELTRRQAAGARVAAEESAGCGERQLCKARRFRQTCLIPARPRMNHKETR